MKGVFKRFQSIYLSLYFEINSTLRTNRKFRYKLMILFKWDGKYRLIFHLNSFIKQLFKLLSKSLKYHIT